MRVRVAYVEEPPFYWTAADGSVTGADIELARVVLRALNVTSIDFEQVRFDELLRGVAAGRWEMNVPIFVTPERARLVDFGIPVWALGDGALVRRGDVEGLDSYGAVAIGRRRLGVIPGQVQFESARAAGVDSARLVEFGTQDAAVEALIAGEIDAFAATMVGNRAIVTAHPELETVALGAGGSGESPVGAFSFAQGNSALRADVDGFLRDYLGSPEHRTTMAEHGLSESEIDPILPRR
jgi:polar amino acid transport system substrate-binding protein